jgi:CDP-L-myo-inositol myo-inositolphosphotransferase
VVTRTAIVTFESGATASRRVAGVAAAARIVRELAEAGFARAWLILPEGDRLSEAAAEDVRRLAGKLDARQADRAPADAEAIHVPGNRLIAAAVIGQSSAGLKLDEPEATRAILRSTAKASDGPVSRSLNRPISRAISALFLKIPGVRPIYATIGTVIIALAMFAALVAGGPWGMIAGGLLFHAASIFDGVDGEIARATFRTSPLGASLDSIVDVGTNVLFIFGATLNLGAQGIDLAYVLGGLGLGLFAFGLAIISWRGRSKTGHFHLEGVKIDYGRVSGRFIPALLRFLTMVSSRDFFALLFAVLIVTGSPGGVLVIFAAAAVVWTPFVLGASLLSRRRSGGRDSRIDGALARQAETEPA